jgi:hypothetical protein
MKVTKDQGSVGNEGFNDSMGKKNMVPNPENTRSKTVKDQGVYKIPTRYPYNSSKGEIRNHQNRG